MSGRKYSNISYDKTREQKRRLVAQIDAHRRAVEGIKQQIEDGLKETTSGLREYFAKETDSAKRWIDRANALGGASRSVTLTNAVSDISERANEFEALVNDGSQLQAGLLEAFVEQAGQLRAEGAKAIFGVESSLGCGGTLINNWYGAEEVARVESIVRRLHEDLRGDRLGDVALRAASLQQELDAKVQQAEANESKYQQRLYVLKGLRQVCAEMGFEEVDPPRSERPGDRMSRIKLIVDTIDRGRVTFYLSLESIEADSCISQNHCFEEFSELSKQLTDTFGIVTKFKIPEAESSPRSARKGELDEPGDADRTVGGQVP
jgi:hypothetical protein